MPTIDPYTVVKDALSPLGVSVRNTIPPPDRTGATFYVVEVEPGPGGARPGWVERVSIAVETWVGDGPIETRKARSIDAGIQARDALWEAWQRNRRSTAGAINYIAEMPYPMLLASGLDNVWRSRFQVDITVRR